MSRELREVALPLIRHAPHDTFSPLRGAKGRAFPSPRVAGRRWREAPRTNTSHSLEDEGQRGPLKNFVRERRVGAYGREAAHQVLGLQKTEYCNRILFPGRA